MEKEEILRYLRTNSKVQDEELLRLIDLEIEEVNAAVNPKSIYRVFTSEVGKDYLQIENMRFQSTRLAENLRGCKRVAVLAATLGTEGDRLLRKYANESARLVIVQAVLTAKIEEVCDGVQGEIEKNFNVKTRQRYSPGYFDLDITSQKKVFELMDITKRCSITLTDTCQMLPTKSVTAFAGIDEAD